MEFLKLRKRAEHNKVEVAQTKGKTTNELVEEIHENFFTEVDKLLAEAKISRALDTDKQDLIDKCERLKKIGFTNTTEVNEAEKEISRLRILKQENEKKKVLIEAIEYFSVAYPKYKFITEESVLKICQKYGLVYGEISRYIGSVPEKNLNHIEQFKVDLKDECYLHEERRSSGFGGGERIERRSYLTKDKFDKNQEIEFGHMHISMYTREINMKCPLEIAAPVKDFNMEGMEVKNFKLSKIEIPDPVVLKPVIFKNQKHYLIVTAWGEEASDEIVVNHINN